MAETTPHDTRLSSKVSISDYLELEKAKDKNQIVVFVRERFTERYITPLKGDPKRKHGFCTMAICCLMIEALESFWQGWKDSNGRSKSAFNSFFHRNQNLNVFCNCANDFYYNVRCGILHQAETKNGWHIRRKGPIFDLETKKINATKFHKAMEECLKYYCNELKKSDWNSKIWEDFRKKMEVIIANCKSGQ
jgi:hypothetical protein